jgi:hypothetical protein
MREAHMIAVLALQRHLEARDWLSLVKGGYISVDAQALDWLLDIMGSVTMARGNGNGSKVQSENWTKFVDISLAGVTKDDISAEYGDIGSIGNGVDSLLRSGYRIGVSFNGTTNSYICSLTCRDDGSPNHGCTVTSHASDWWLALQVMLYKHFVVARENWLEVSPSPSGETFG